jgi:cell division septation protein DedD
VSRRYNDDLDLEDMQSNNNSEGDREISLGATTILGIFFALSLICAVVFGFGYSMGRRSTQPLSATVPSATTEPAQSTLDTPKPSPGSLAPVAPDNDAAASATQPEAQPDAQPDASANQPPAPVAKPISLSRTAAPALSTSEPVVQVAAVSHKEDATILISALKKRGYTASVRQEPQDKLLHVQLGPFPSKTAADAMRDHLLSDGYNAIVK